MTTAAEVRGMFDAVAPRYDLLNHLLSGGLDVLWRRRLVREAALPAGEKVLDVCCGTGDLALAFARRGARVVGSDFSPAMLARARAKGLSALASGDALALPFPDGAFAASACAFGLRNTADWGLCAREMARVVRPGGLVAVLDFALPAGPVFGALYRAYLRGVLPRLAGLLSRREAYDYLQASVARFDREADVPGMLRSAGCPEVRRVALASGAACAWLGRRG